MFSSDDTIEFKGSPSTAPFNRAMASSADEANVHGGAYKSSCRTFDVETHTGADLDTVHLEMEYLGASMVVVVSGASSSAMDAKGDKKTVAAAAKEAMLICAKFVEMLRCFSPSWCVAAIDIDADDTDSGFNCGVVGVTNPSTDFETANKTATAIRRCEDCERNMVYIFLF